MRERALVMLVQHAGILLDVIQTQLGLVRARVPIPLVLEIVPVIVVCG